MSTTSVFTNRHKFQDDVWNEIHLNDLERDVIDTPEFQRLFRTSQMGFVDLVYQTANHTRGAHSIGACHVANDLVDRLRQNLRHLGKTERESALYAPFEISQAERVLIRLGALLHDVSHVPLSHDLEKKNHKITRRNGREISVRSWYGHYDKHDDYDSNPVLYLLLFDQKNSVLAQVLRRYSRSFSELLLRTGKERDKKGRYPHLHDFVRVISSSKSSDWSVERDLLPELLFHLLVFEKPSDAANATLPVITKFGGTPTNWHLGPKSLTADEQKEWHTAWYQPFRHDIIGNTLSADLIDYLTRDPQRLGNKRRIDLHLLNYYLLVRIPPGSSTAPGTYRSAIDLHDHKRGTTRTFLLNDVFRLLDLRQEIHEKAVMHRIVQSANAMVSRALLLLRNNGQLPELREIIAFGEDHHALQSEEVFFNQLLERCSGAEATNNGVKAINSDVRRLLQKIFERRVYRPLMIIPGDRAALLPATGDGQAQEAHLRMLAALVDSARYSSFLLFVCATLEKYLEGYFATSETMFQAVKAVAEDPRLLQQAMKLTPTRILLWTLPYKQLYKDPAVVVSLEGCVGRIDEISKDSHVPPLRDESTKERIRVALNDADTKYATLWRLYVFISDGLFYSGIIAKLLGHLSQKGIRIEEREVHSTRIRYAEQFLTVALRKLCEEWKACDTKLEQEAGDHEAVLAVSMETERFQWLIEEWANTSGHTIAPGAYATERLSAVDVMNYVHDFSLSQDVSDVETGRCRDVRYKFDMPATDLWRESTSGSATRSTNVVQFLKACNIGDPNLLSRRELDQVAELYAHPVVRKRCTEQLSLAALNPSLLPDAITALWSGDFPFMHGSEVDAPDAPEKIRQRLRLIGDKLRSKRGAYGHWARANDRIAAFIEGKTLEIRKDILADLDLRASIEAQLFWNNFKENQIMHRLHAQWR